MPHQAHSTFFAYPGLPDAYRCRTAHRRDLFHNRGRVGDVGPTLVYAGKYSRAKGLPFLLDAVERLGERFPDLVLHVAGEGAGSEAEALRARMKRMAPRVVLSGQLSQEQLGHLMRQCAVFVLPSFYEGFPLFLVEALACGCRVVCTDLPGLRDGFGKQLARVLSLVAMPRLVGPDTPVEQDVPAFVDRLVAALTEALHAPALDASSSALSTALIAFAWDAIFQRIERVWTDLAGPGA